MLNSVQLTYRTCLNIQQSIFLFFFFNILFLVMLRLERDVPNSRQRSAVQS